MLKGLSKTFEKKIGRIPKERVREGEIIKFHINRFRGSGRRLTILISFQLFYIMNFAGNYFTRTFPKELLQHFKAGYTFKGFSSFFLFLQKVFARFRQNFRQAHTFRIQLIPVLLGYHEIARSPRVLQTASARIGLTACDAGFANLNIFGTGTYLDTDTLHHLYKIPPTQGAAGFGLRHFTHNS